MATDKPSTNTEALDIRDVLSGIPLDGTDAALLGACISFQTVGNSTVIVVDTDGPGPAAPIPIATLANVTGVTLQQLLNDIPIDGN